MEIVIELDDDVYKEITEEFLYYAHTLEMASAIKEGIPLPKEHGRLVDADVLEEMKEPMYEPNGEMKGYGVLMNDIRQFAPTIIEADKESDEE